VTQLVLPLHECVAEPLQDIAEDVADSVAAESVADPAAADPTAVESVAELLHAIADPTAAATPTKASCLCIRV
jgi:hypothetical protein